MIAPDAASRIAAQGGTTLVMYGKGADETARAMLPKLPAVCFAPVDLRELRAAVEHGLAQVVLIAGMDELAAAAGDGGVLEAITLDMDGGRALADEVAGAPTALRAYELWEAAGRLGPCGRELCRRVAGELERHAAEAAGTDTSPIAAQAVLVDSTGRRMVGMFGRMAR
ncbi:hypothetical protein AGRA3207_001866 [Actinomadura graeca]|uniref:Uncharacterized protein n=1 Tax=Actinomadura graeca TaxID=2750812 RepID=A0ABX8QQH9_9ACTN|nr:hypothetical protein [Actinomadura graeca]QXJ21051.1 hypothetical protein AGRA3207_001866 [Actinomadura graeca]